MGRTEEREFQYMMLRLMEDGKIWTNAKLKAAIGQELELSAGDRSRALERPNEAKYEQLINNALAPARKSSLYGKGALTNMGHGEHRINDAGRALLEDLRQREAIFDAAFRKEFGDDFSLDDLAEKVLAKKA